MAIDGEVLELVSTDLVHKYSPARSDGLSLSMTAKSLSIQRQRRTSSQQPGADRPAPGFRSPVSLEEARRKIAAIQSLIEAIGKPGIQLPSSSRSTHRSTASPLPAVVDWWSRAGCSENRGTVPSLTGIRSAAAASGTDGSDPQSSTNLGALCAPKWIALCDESSSSTLRPRCPRRGLEIDARGRSSRLPSVEDISQHAHAARSSPPRGERSQLLTDDDDRLLIHRQMVELCWNTYLQIKHVPCGEVPRTADVPSRMTTTKLSRWLPSSCTRRCSPPPSLSPKSRYRMSSRSVSSPMMTTAGGGQSGPRWRISTVRLHDLDDHS